MRQIGLVTFVHCDISCPVVHRHFQPIIEILLNSGLILKKNLSTKAQHTTGTPLLHQSHSSKVEQTSQIGL